MLAAASAWRILESEQLLDAIAGALKDGTWRHQRAQRNVIRRLIREYREFETQTHRPKGIVLLDSVRGRSAQADQLLDVLEHECEECDQLLTRAIQLLDTLERGEGAEAEEAATLLERHRELMMRHLDEEDTVLRSYTSQLLTSDEWSAVVSSISSVARRPKGRGM